MRHIAFFCLFLWVGGVVVAQPQLDALHSLGVKEGLSQSSVAFMFRDSRGFMWLSSADGLNRFDGRVVKVYRPNAQHSHSMLGSNIQSDFFEESTNGNLWFSTWEGINCYRRASDDFVYYQLKDGSGKLYSEGYHVIFRDSEGWLWVHIDDASVAAGGVVYRFQPKTGLQVRIGELGGLRFVADTLAYGTVARILGWHLTEKKGLEMLSPLGGQSDWKRQVFFGEAAATNSTKISGCFIENSHRIWLASQQGLMLFDPIANKSTVFPQLIAQKAISFFDVIALDTRYLLCSTRKYGLYVFDRLTQQFTTHILPEASNAYGLSDVRNDDLYLDPTRTLWISHWTQGVQYGDLDKPKFQTLHLDRSFPALREKSYFLQNILQDKQQRVWVITDVGDVFRINAATREVTQIPFPDKAASRLATDLLGQIWCLNSRGMYLFDEKTTAFRSIFGAQLKEGLSFRCLLHRKNGDMLVGTYSGLYKLIPQKDQSYKLEKYDIQSQVSAVEHLYEDPKGNLWIDANYTSLLFLGADGRRASFEIGESRALYQTPDGKTTYVATDKGLVSIDQKSLTHTIINEANGLPNQYLFAVLPDQKGRLWLTSSRSIIAYTTATKAFWQYSRFDGVWEDEFFPDVSLQLPNGEIWVGNRQVINIFQPNNIKPSTKPVPIQITSIYINDAQTCIARAVGELTNLQMPHDSSTVTFRFAALDFSDPTATQFRYILEGYDRDTIHIEKGALGSARYAQLPAGNYTFKVWAANSDGVWNPNPRILQLHILPAWYQTWWFRVFVLSIIVGSAWWLIRLRTSNLLALQRVELEKQQMLMLERERIARDMHDDLGSGLSALQILSNHAKNNATDPNTRAEMTKIADSSAQLNQSIREIIWTVHTADDSLAALIYFLRRFCADFEDLTEIDIRLLASDNLPDIKLSGEQRRNVFMCIKETLNNALKYAEATKIIIQIEEKGTKINFVITDNGKGFDVNQAYQRAGNGLRNIQSRMNDIGGTAQFDSQIGQTRVTLSL